MSPLVEINDPAFAAEHTIIVDARGGKDSLQRYQNGHLQNAAYIDLDTHLAAKVVDAANGGRHPLPSTEELSFLLGSLGITPQSHVIIYDDKSGAMSAARFWWMLRAIGHKNVQVLNGGLQAAVNAGINLSVEDYVPVPANPYPITNGYTGTVNIQDIEAATADPDRLVIDVRETPRYLGLTEPIDLVAGHIPGAKNLPYVNNLDANGKYLPADKLHEMYTAFIGDIAPGQVIVHCGSGVTACHTLLGMAYAGIEEPKLYVGSWSEWSRTDRTIATGE